MEKEITKIISLQIRLIFFGSHIRLQNFRISSRLLKMPWKCWI